VVAVQKFLHIQNTVGALSGKAVYMEGVEGKTKIT
jgi:hypothetical protein